MDARTGAGFLTAPAPAGVLQLTAAALTEATA
jgi:hypothetical protein